MLLKELQASFLLQRKFRRHLGVQQRLQKKQYAELIRILHQKEIVTVFQPIIQMHNGQLVGYEALNRPKSSSSFHTTEEFYRFLGETDQIFEFENLTRRQSIESYVELKKESGLESEELIFLNVHPYVLSDTNYKSGNTLRYIKAHGLEPRQIVFEITEKQAVEDYSKLEKVLTNYRLQGFKIAIDDVGAGYNSLKTMMYIKPDFIKLDRSFIQNIDRNMAQQKLVTLFVQYATQSNSQVIAEGVERIEELQCLKALKVNYAQGYYIGKPSPYLSNHYRMDELVNY